LICKGRQGRAVDLQGEAGEGAGLTGPLAVFDRGCLPRQSKDVSDVAARLDTGESSITVQVPAGKGFVARSKCSSRCNGANLNIENGGVLSTGLGGGKVTCIV
jgi:hypothetical protein